MSLALLVDVNLTPDWVALFQQAGYAAVHWSSLGPPATPDHVIMAWAVANRHAVFTHDLDFGTLLATTHTTEPSVVQLRGHDVLPTGVGAAVVAALRRYEAELLAGALVVVDPNKARVRVLPIP